MKFSEESKGVLVGISVLLCIFGAAWMWKMWPFLALQNKQTSSNVEAGIQQEATQTKKEQAPEQKQESWTNTAPKTKTFTEFTDDDIRHGQVQWQEPEDLGDLGWTRKDVYNGSYNGGNDEGSSGGVRYVKVGKIIAGKYKGADVLMVLSWFYFPQYPRGDAPDIEHYIRLKDNSIVFLPYASIPNGKDIQSQDWKNMIFDEANDPLVFRIPRKSVGENTRIEDLASFDEEIQDVNNLQTFTREEPESYRGTAFLSLSGLKSIFNHPQYGQIWMVDETKKRDGDFPLNQYIGRVYDQKRTDYERKKTFYDPIVSGGFYIRRPDGIAIPYRLRLDIFDVSDRAGILQATWNDGRKNETSYEQYPSGCGMGGYAYDMTGKINVKKDLIKTGVANTGDLLYEYKPSNKALKKYYNDTYLPSLKYRSTYDTNIPASDWGSFLHQHAIVFWVDPFGRILEFFNTETFPLAECGKPVIYLYPTQTTPVSVQVFPSEGVSVSDPGYGNGWSVIAHPDGKLLNTTDNKEYPYLFWEGGSNVLYQTPREGFVVKRERLNEFFNEKLASLGLIEKEIADFKEFWVSKMLEVPKPYYFVTFLSRNTIDQLAPLHIEPKPDTIIRVMMDYQGLDAWKNVPGYTLHAPERRGFTAVEWGGRLQR